MKVGKLLLSATLILALSAVATASQNTLQGLTADSTEHNDPPKNDWLIFDITLDRFLAVPDAIDQHIYSPGVTISLFKTFVRAGVFSVAGGLGISSFNPRNNAQYELTTYNNGQSTVRMVPLTSSYTKNKLAANYLEGSLEFRLKSNRSRPLRLHLGLKGGWMFAAHTKTKRNDKRFKDYNIPHLNPFRYGVYARTGYNYLNLFAFYGLSELFETGKGEILQPVSAGVSISF